MPIKIPNDLPASQHLTAEGISLIKEQDAIRQDIRPMQIGLLNLMPNKETTELQIARLLGGSPLQIELTLITMGSYSPKNTPEGHLQKFYSTTEQVMGRKFDGLIITGAPVEKMEFAEVDYWQELTQFLDWAEHHVFSLFSICWGAQAALYHYRKINKYLLPEKAFGIFSHRTMDKTHPLLRGFDDEFYIPVSRWTSIEKLPQGDDSLKTLLVSDSDDQTPCLLFDEVRRALYMFNHIEYDRYTLNDEYQRDKKAGQKIALPKNYYPDDDDSQPPHNHWRSHAHLLFANWLNEVYQGTPFDIKEIKKNMVSQKKINEKNSV